MMNDTSPLGEAWPKIKSRPQGIRLSLAVPRDSTRDGAAGGVMPAPGCFERILQEDPADGTRSGQLTSSQGSGVVEVVRSSASVVSQARESGAQLKDRLADWLVLAGDDTLRQVLAGITGMDSAATHRLQFQPGRSTIVQIGPALHRPVIQAVNTGHFARLVEQQSGAALPQSPEAVRGQPGTAPEAT